MSKPANQGPAKTDYSWVGNLVATLGLIIGVFVILANRPPATDKLIVDAQSIRHLAKSSRVSSPPASPVVSGTASPGTASPGTASTPVVPSPKRTSIEWTSAAPPFMTVPMTAEEVQALQQRWSEYLGIPVEYKNSVGISMVLVPPGDFRMGGTDSQLRAGFGVVNQNDEHWMSCYKSAAPQHDVRLTLPYYISRYEITQQQYSTVMKQNPSWHADTGKEAYYRDIVKGIDTNSYPVEGVSWLDCVDFCHRLSDLEKKMIHDRLHQSPNSSNFKASFNDGYRLPTEAEWEMAYRAGTDTRFFNGDEQLAPTDAGWHGKIHGGRSHRVGELPGNALGLHDMGHNVWEWVDDRFDPEYYKKIYGQVTRDPIGSETGDMRIVRGGMWPNADTAAFDRYAYYNDYQCCYVGFRIVLAVPNEKLPARNGNEATAPLD